jgi:hypothetical protein
MRSVRAGATTHRAGRGAEFPQGRYIRRAAERRPSEASRRTLGTRNDHRDARSVFAVRPEWSVYRTPRSEVSDIGERQRTRSRAVEIREVVLLS